MLERVLGDPELYRAFDVAAALQKPYVVAHLAAVHRQLVGLVAEAAGPLGGDTPERQAALLFGAMAAFHHPTLVDEHPTGAAAPPTRPALGEGPGQPRRDPRRGRNGRARSFIRDSSTGGMMRA